MALTVLFVSNTSIAEAKGVDVNEDIMYEQGANVVASDTITKAYNFEKSSSSYNVGAVRKRSTSTLQLIMPNDKGRSYMQGNVSFTPMSGGRSIDIKFANYATENYMVPLDSVPEGAYFLHISGAVVGSSGQARVVHVYNAD